MEKVSLKQIAKELNVSAATVSLVLNKKNGNGRVSKELSQKILDKARELNYTPNNLALGLKMGRSKTIGLIVADISNPFFGTLALHVQNFAQENGYTVIIGNTNEQLPEMKKMINLLKGRQVDGFIMSPTEGSEKLIDDLEKEEVPLVLVDRAYPQIKTNRVLINNYDISYKATKGLVDRGCKNIALLTYRQDHFHINERKRGYVDAVKAAGIYAPQNIKEVRYGFLKDDIENAIVELLDSEKPVDGIFFTTNSISILGVKTLYKHHVKIQEDIQITCFDESDAFYLLPYTVPFIKQPIQSMAKKAIELIINQIEGMGLDVETSIIDAELIE